LLWEDRARDDYLYWQTQGKKTLKKINMLIKDIQSLFWHSALLLSGSCK
ncbi:MAG: type II toxin-antitoxin system YoeB family toxin, partial [Lachnospiraceae bacterium]|nr:type II toxin-antitoxin system YoeB family toxin [Lachnospiraceae bacterium]